MSICHLHVHHGVVGEGVKFQRIRRITGYLVGSLDRFNNGKRAELHDRVRHLHLGGGKAEYDLSEAELNRLRRRDEAAGNEAQPTASDSAGAA